MIQSSCDMDDPDEFAGWAVKHLCMASGDVLNLLENDARSVSAQLWKAGFRHHPELQTHRVLGAREGNLAALGAEWAEIVAGEVAAPAEVPDVRKLSLDDKLAILAQLREDGIGDHDVPPPSVEGLAEVSE